MSPRAAGEPPYCRSAATLSGAGPAAPARSGSARGGCASVATSPTLALPPVGKRIARASSTESAKRKVSSSTHLLRDLLEVLLVLPGQQHLRHLVAVRREHLLLDPADRQQAAGQRDLARHGEPARHGHAPDRRQQRGRQGDSRRGPVLGDRALGHVHVDVPVLREVRGDAQLCVVGAQEGEGCLRALLHHVAEAAREHQLALAREDGHLHGQELAAELRPRQAIGEPGLHVLREGALDELHLAEVAASIARPVT